MKDFLNKILIKLGLKKTGFNRLQYMGIPVVVRDDVPSGIIYLIDSSKMYINYPRCKDGSYDMRFSINRLWQKKK